MPSMSAGGLSMVTVRGAFGPDHTIYWHTVPSTPRPLTGTYSYLLAPRILAPKGAAGCLPQREQPGVCHKGSSQVSATKGAARCLPQRDQPGVCHKRISGCGAVLIFRRQRQRLHVAAWAGQGREWSTGCSHTC